jgi:DNA-binding PadR family transcriptional regulator
MTNSTKYNFYPLLVHCVVEEEKASFADIMKYVQKAVGGRIDPNAVFSALSKLVEDNVLKINEDTTGTFSLGDWKTE